MHILRKYFMLYSLIFLGCSHGLPAQDFSGIIEMRLTEFDSQQLKQIYPELNTDQILPHRAIQILSHSNRELFSRAEKAGLKPQYSHIKMRFAKNWFRADIPQKGLNLSMIQNLQTNKIINVHWAKSLYTEIDLVKIAEMKRGLREYYKNPPDPLAYLEKLSPGQRSEILQKLPPETIKRLKENRGPFPLPQKPDAKEFQKVIKTGRTARISGFSCIEYRIEKPGKMLSVWVASAPAGLLQALKSMSRNFSRIGEDQAIHEIWKVTPGHMPVLTRELTFAATGELMLVITQMTSLKKQPVSAKVFQVPPHFKKASMMELLDLGRGSGRF